MPEKRTSLGPELLVPLDARAGRSRRAQLEDRLRAAIRAGSLAAGRRLPATRVLARELGVSRGVVVQAYAQLDAEGYLVARPGAPTRVAPGVRPDRAAPAPAARTPAPPRYDFRPGVPDLGLFPRAAWLAALRQALGRVPDAALGYGDARGMAGPRAALAGYLGRVRGVAADAERVLICGGMTQALGLLGRELRAAGAARLALEDPAHPELHELVRRAGLEPVPVPVDEDGLRVDALERAGADAVLVTPAHQFPSGVVLAPERRAALLAWARAGDRLAIEDDYDAEYRYDVPPVGALQGLAPDHVAYLGSVSKTIAPALRIGWVVAPARLIDGLARAKRYADLGSPGLDQLALAELIETGGLDRHLRRARVRYRARRDALVRALARHVPGARVRGVAAGLHAVAELPGGVDEGAAVAAAARRGVAVYGMRGYRALAADAPAALVLGYAALSEPAIAAGIAELGRALADLA